ncbi:hypothetical protein PGT21_021620 [Puccinia graminis f. sp. tritici]|uniref:Uncharacterized protein n=1 Tax=Puccinia graminis f. sp. tritici TaxID=56615 RepID=A0A5B0QUR9_PUCGR|nr:hypothetical protein PGT21_021620 [Puccinia graminis f. sp. tritici]
MYQLAGRIPFRRAGTQSSLSEGNPPEGFLRAHVQEYKARTEGFPIEPRRGSLEGANEVGRRTKLSRVTELIARLKSRGKLNQVIYNALLNALFSTREFESGLEVFKLMKLELDSSQNAHPGIELLTSEDGRIESGYPRGCGYPLTISAETHIRIRRRIPASVGGYPRGYPRIPAL